MPSSVLIEFPEELNVLQSAGVNERSESRKRKVHQMTERPDDYNEDDCNNGIVYKRCKRVYNACNNRSRKSKSEYSRIGKQV